MKWLYFDVQKTFPFVTLNYFNELSNLDGYCQPQLKQFYYCLEYIMHIIEDAHN